MISVDSVGGVIAPTEQQTPTGSFPGTGSPRRPRERLTTDVVSSAAEPPYHPLHALPRPNIAHSPLIEISFLGIYMGLGICCAYTAS